MVAKAVGVLVGIAVMFAWFYLIGTRPVAETVIGLLLGIGGGLWAWAAVRRWIGGSEPGDRR